MKRNEFMIDTYGSKSNNLLGLSIKDVRSQGAGMTSADILQTRRILQMRTFAFFGVKNFEFFKIYGVSA